MSPGADAKIPLSYSSYSSWNQHVRFLIFKSLFALSKNLLPNALTMSCPSTNCAACLLLPLDDPLLQAGTLSSSSPLPRGPTQCLAHSKCSKMLGPITISDDSNNSSNNSKLLSRASTFIFLHLKMVMNAFPSN